MKIGYLGYDDTARKIKKIFVGKNGVARRCTKAYVGVNDKAQIIYPTGNFPIPSVSGSYTFDNQPHSAVITNIDYDAVNIIGQTTAVDSGTYPLIFRLASQYYKWTDGTSADKTGSWSIATVTVQIPTILGTYTFTGSTQNVVISNYDTDYVQVTGVTSAKNAGTYTVYFELKHPNGTVWSDGTTGQKSATWTIARQKLTVPQLQGTYYYTGSSQTVYITAYDTSLISQSGITSAIEVGTYTVTFSIINDINYEWTDGTTSSADETWNIQKMQVHFAVTSRYGNPTVATATLKDVNNKVIDNVTIQARETKDEEGMVEVNAPTPEMSQSAGVATYKHYLGDFVMIEGYLEGSVDLNVFFWVDETAMYTAATGKTTIRIAEQNL